MLEEWRTARFGADLQNPWRLPALTACRPTAPCTMSCTDIGTFVTLRVVRADACSAELLIEANSRAHAPVVTKDSTSEASTVTFWREEPCSIFALHQFADNALGGLSRSHLLGFGG